MQEAWYHVSGSGVMAEQLLETIRWQVTAGAGPQPQLLIEEAGLGWWVTTTLVN